MKRSTKEYIDERVGAVVKYVDKEVTWVRTLKQSENYWLEKFLESEQRSAKEQQERNFVTNDQRFHAQNEWRQTFKDQQSQYLTKREFWAGILMVAIAFLALYFKK